MMASQSRPEPMNASPYHSKIKATVSLSDPQFVAGSKVCGKVELECRADKGLGIGVIMAELFAIQELTSRDHSATSTFLHLTRRFQGPSLPPSNAVDPFPRPDSEPLPLDHYPARKGVTTFFFKFPLPESSPSSIDFGKGIAKLRYAVKASVGVAWKGERQLVTDIRDVDVVESFNEFGSESGQHVVIGEHGKIWVEGRIVNRVVVAGQPTCVELHVKNHSSKKTTSLTLTLMRHLHLPSVSQSTNLPKSLQVSDTLVTVPFKGSEYIVHPGTEGIANLVFEVPKNVRGVRGGLRDGGDGDEFATDRLAHPHGKYMESLFEVRCIVSVRIGMGISNKDIVLDLPATIVHPTALPKRNLLDSFALSSPVLQSSASPNIYHRMQSPQPFMNPMASLYSPMQPTQALPNPLISPRPLSPYQPSLPWQYHEQQHLNPWSPPPLGYVSPPLAAPFDAPQLPYYFPPPPPAMLAQYTARPSSAEPYSYQQLPPLLSSSHSAHSGLPAAAAPHFPTNLSTSPTFNPLQNSITDGEEGKGERASRISAHLRLSSRHRSVSPKSHRFPLPVQGHTGMYESPFSTGAEPTNGLLSPVQLQQDLLQQDLLHASPDSSSSSGLVSPRPMPSPRNTYDVDPFTNIVTVGKNQHVAQLEKMAVETSDLQGLGEFNASVEQTANAVQVAQLAISSSLESTATKEKRGEELKDNDQVDATPRVPAQPRLAPLKSFKPDYRSGPSGLDALEKKLLEQVGTRKPEVPKKPDVRSILIPPPEQDIRDPLPTNESNISSLVLAGGPEFDGDVLDNAEKGTDDQVKRPPKSAGKSTVKGGASDLEDEKNHLEDKKKRSEAKELRKAATSRVAAWLGGLGLHDSLPDVPSSCNERNLPDNAPSRIEDLPSPGQPIASSSPHDVVDEVTELVPPDDAKPTYLELPRVPQRSSGFVLHATLKNDPAFAQAVKEVLAADEDKVKELPPLPSESTTDNEADKRIVRQTRARAKEVPAYLLSAANGPNYDIRSARGGRGGKVASVTALWASLADKDTSQPSQKKASRSISPEPLKASSPAKAGYFKPLTQATEPKVVASLDAVWKPGQAENRRLNVVKSSSVPAVLSSKLATPVLSSTASLARPAPHGGVVRRSLPVVKESEDEQQKVQQKSAVKGEIMFGQERLKELIKKYQQT